MTTLRAFTCDDLFRFNNIFFQCELSGYVNLQEAAEIQEGVWPVGELRQEERMCLEQVILQVCRWFSGAPQDCFGGSASNLDPLTETVSFF
ncbi:hypothetical protein QTO34_001854 [Cnephaeus nilssonii]|uniref:Uncharacterized protein n=1 Tax=Cnephaeus nilssonii TaxID=3371016 RepID=A0AA40LKT7_CNENI|nr:hypothetical protein QTO34_001854 [Eptesicus nilssonii]